MLVAGAMLVGGCGGGGSSRDRHAHPAAPSGRTATGAVTSSPPRSRRTRYTSIPAVRVAAAPALQVEPVFSDRGWSFQGVTIADMDGDGRRDIVAVDGARGVVIARQLASGSWMVVRSPGVYRAASPEHDQRHVAVADIDGDGHPDVVTVAGIDRPAVTIAAGDGRGRVRAARMLRPAGLDSVGADGQLADLDGDGRPDLVLATIRSGRFRRSGRGITVLAGRPRGTFAAAMHPAAISSAGRVVATDLNGDGDRDLIVDRAIVLARGGGRFAAPRALGHPASFGPVLQQVRGRRVIGEWETTYGNRLAVLARNGRAESHRLRATSLQLDRQGYTPSPINVRELYSGPGLDAILPDGGGELLWISRAVPGGRFTIPIPTLLPRSGRVLAVADLDGDRLTDIVAADDNGRIVVLHNRGMQPLARLVLPSQVPFVAADHSIRVTVRCTPGAGACAGFVKAGQGGTEVRLVPGRSARLRIVLARRAQPRRVTLRYHSAFEPTHRDVSVTGQNGRQRAGACEPLPGGKVAARSSRLAVLTTADGPPLVCDLATGGQSRFSEDATASAVSAYGPFAGMVEDVCPGGFEDCYLDMSVRRFPGRQPVTGLQWGTAVGSLAVGRDGALAFLSCSPLDETVECDPAPGGDIYRLDARGLKRMAHGDDIPVHSLRRSTDGRSFSWIQGGRRRTASWSGRPRRSP